MKRVIFLICINFMVTGYAQDNVAMYTNSESIWEQDFSIAEKLTKSTDKPMMIFFTGSDWCGPCKMLVADVFESEKFKNEFKDEFILYEADTPRNKNLITGSQKVDNDKLKKKYNVNSFPTIVVVNGKGKEIARKKSYNLMRDTSYHFLFFEETLKKYK
ncbi:thioredoxin family protein [Lutibacter sp. A80]|uniref:thioredoxin family protein n=1 Tax=Lutibacter sp. A80 TaxID=2918453 RepID=UPI001F05984E|nr:thioredoxin family protein [Lutibacter sp. A80]UMB60558.1 thioredoxin family protein [Lutibacter sp. A80]